LFSLEVSGFSGFSFRLSATSGKLDNAKVETEHRPSAKIIAPNLSLLRQIGFHINPKDADKRARRREAFCAQLSRRRAICGG
jgi:hypothetical protein